MGLFRSPTMPPGVRRALRLPSSRARLARELDDEVRFHLETRVADLVARGMTEADARNEALRRFGDAEDLRDYCASIQEHHMRRMQFREWLEAWGHDIRFASRQFKRTPGFVAITVATLALGIGATTAIFSVVNGVLLRALPYPDADRLMTAWEAGPKGGHSRFTDPNYEDLRAQNRSFTAMAEIGGVGVVTVQGNGDAIRARLAPVSRDFFTVLGVTPLRGRVFSDDEARTGGPAAVIVSYRFWQRELGGVASAVGSTLKIGGQSAMVVGVMPATVDYPAGTDLWIAAEVQAHYPSRTAHNWDVLGRLAPGVSLAQARGDASAIGRRLKEEYAGHIDLVDIALVPLRDRMVGGSRSALLLLLGASFVLLLIACANVVNLLVARMAARHGEVALRLALGAARYRLVQQCLAESLMLAAGGCAAGLVLAKGGVKLLQSLNPTNVPRLSEIDVDWRVLVFAAAVSLAGAVVLGLVAAWHGTRGELRESLSQGQRTQSGGASSEGTRRTLVVMQIAMTLVLLVGAGLLGLSFLQLMKMDTGYRTDHAVILDLSVPASDSAGFVRRAQFYDALVERLRTIPGVTAVGGSSSMPVLSAAPNGTFLVMSSPDEYKKFKGYEAFEVLSRDPKRKGDAEFSVVTGDYFTAMGIPRLSGRLFEDRDSPDGPHVAVVSQSFANSKWPGESPLGKFVEFGNMDGDLRVFTIIGVVGDIRDGGLGAERQPMLYGLLRQRSHAPGQFITLATPGDPAPVMATARRIVREMRPDVPPRLRTIESIVSSSVADRAFVLVLISVFAGVALAVAALGVYSVISYLVTQRERELCIRMALGARSADIVRLVLGQGATMAAIGIVLGAVASIALTGLVSKSLYGITATDPVAFVAVIGLLTVVSLAASWLPARRAARVQAMDALRSG